MNVEENVKMSINKVNIEGPYMPVFPQLQDINKRQKVETKSKET